MKFQRILLLALMLFGFANCRLAGAAPADLITQTKSTDCGPAALATLLNFYLFVPTTEAEMMKLADYTDAKGTSLQGLEKAATAKHCAADSFRMDLPTLEKQMATYPLPVIVRIKIPEDHFVVLLALDEEYAYIADPASGNIALRKPAFLRRWYFPKTHEGYVFIAAGPDGRIDTERRNRVLKEIARKVERLKTIDSHEADFRR